MLGAGALLIAYLAWIWWRTRVDPSVVFLSSHDGAEWIRHDEPFNLATRSAGSIEQGFRIGLRLKSAPDDAVLEVRALKRFSVLVDGKVSLLNFKYHVGRYLAGQSVELVLRDGLIEIFHDAVLVATHARRHLPEQDDAVQRQAVAAAPTRPAADRVVIRKVGGGGSVSFAGADYRVGNAFRGRQVEVGLAGDTVQIWGGGKLLRTHAAKHDRRREHGASQFLVGGRNGPMPPNTLGLMSAGTGAVLSCGYRGFTRMNRSVEFR